MVYAEAGWAGVADWLGTGNRRGGWRSLEKARAFVRGLGLKSVYDWYAYCKSGEKPDDIPVAPHKHIRKLAGPELPIGSDMRLGTL